MTEIVDHPPRQPSKRFSWRPAAGNRAAVGTFAVFIVMMIVFFLGNPSVFSDWRIYNSVLITLPVALFLVIPLVFIVTVGEIDLSFPAVMGFSAWIFALTIQAGLDPIMSFVAGVATGMVLGTGIGAIVVYGGLSSLVATLGLSYLLRGAILIATSGKSIPLVTIKESLLYQVLAGTFLASLSRCCGRRLLSRRRSSSITGINSARGSNASRQSRQRGANGDQHQTDPCRDVPVHGVRCGTRRHLLNHDQFHLVAIDRRSLSLAVAGGGVRRRDADLGWNRHGCRRRFRDVDRFLHSGGHRVGRARRLLRAVLPWSDHHPGADRAPLEPGAVSLMTNTRQKRRRDYSLVGPDTAAAIETGLAQAEWYHSDVPRKAMKELMQRSDGRALRDAGIWFAGLFISGGLAAAFWGTWWCVPLLFVYGTLYGSASDARWHECGHGTAFRTRWMNDVVYQIASFMQIRNPVTWPTEPCTSPYRHAHRWTRRRDRGDAAARSRQAHCELSRPGRCL
jgi:hypothetical protein